jgi:hypothetical protein
MIAIEMAIGRSLHAVLLSLMLLGCGGNSPRRPPVGFVNQTRHSDAELWVLWNTAQQNLARRIDLNPVQESSAGAPAEVLPGDPRALNVLPLQLTVASAPDVSSQTLFAATGTRRPDPTGMIACPQPCNVSYSTAYSLYQPAVTKYAASWESSGSSFDSILEYEFENQILFTLGYDMSWR